MRTRDALTLTMLFLGFLFMVRPDFVFSGALYAASPFVASLYGLPFVVAGAGMALSSRPASLRMRVLFLPLTFHYLFNIVNIVLQSLTEMHPVAAAPIMMLYLFPVILIGHYLRTALYE